MIMNVYEPCCKFFVRVTFREFDIIQILLILNMLV